MNKPTRPQPPPALIRKTTNQPSIRETRMKPATPPVYHPQPVPKVLQRKVAGEQGKPPAHPKHGPVAPPVYRPQPVPKVLQRKPAAIQPQPAGVPKSMPSAPPAYRPQPIPGALQRKVANEGRPNSGQLRARPKAPPVYRPGASPKVLQRKVGGNAPAPARHSSPQPARPSYVLGEGRSSGMKTSGRAPGGVNVIQRVRFYWGRSDGTRPFVDTEDPNNPYYNDKNAANFFAKNWKRERLAIHEKEIEEGVKWLQHFKEQSGDRIDAIVAMREELELGKSVTDNLPQLGGTEENKSRKRTMDKYETLDYQKAQEQDWKERLKRAKEEKAREEKTGYAKPSTTSVYKPAMQQTLTEEGVWPDNYGEHDADAVKKKYQKALRRLHPDKGGDGERFKAFKSAYDAYFDSQGNTLT
jgi:hypothetical protein